MYLLRKMKSVKGPKKARGKEQKPPKKGSVKLGKDFIRHWETIDQEFADTAKLEEVIELVQQGIVSQNVYNELVKLQQEKKVGRRKSRQITPGWVDKPIIQGHLFKKSVTRTFNRYRWPKLFFILYGDRLEYFKKKGAPKPLGVIDITKDYHLSDFIAESEEKLPPNHFMLSNFENTYYFAAETKELKRYWLHTMKLALRKIEQASQKHNQPILMSNHRKSAVDLKKEYSERVKNYRSSVIKMGSFSSSVYDSEAGSHRAPSIASDNDSQYVVRLQYVEKDNLMQRNPNLAKENPFLQQRGSLIEKNTIDNSEKVVSGPQPVTERRPAVAKQGSKGSAPPLPERNTTPRSTNPRAIETEVRAGKHELPAGVIGSKKPSLQPTIAPELLPLAQDERKADQSPHITEPVKATESNAPISAVVSGEGQIANERPLSASKINAAKVYEVVSGIEHDPNDTDLLETEISQVDPEPRITSAPATIENIKPTVDFNQPTEPTLDLNQPIKSTADLHQPTEPTVDLDQSAGIIADSSIPKEQEPKPASFVEKIASISDSLRSSIVGYFKGPDAVPAEVDEEIVKENEKHVSQHLGLKIISDAEEKQILDEVAEAKAERDSAARQLEKSIRVTNLINFQEQLLKEEEAFYKEKGDYAEAERIAKVRKSAKEYGEKQEALTAQVSLAKMEAEAVLEAKAEELAESQATREIAVEMTRQDQVENPKNAESAQNAQQAYLDIAAKAIEAQRRAEEAAKRVYERARKKGDQLAKEEAKRFKDLQKATVLEVKRREEEQKAQEMKAKAKTVAERKKAENLVLEAALKRQEAEVLRKQKEYEVKRIAAAKLEAKAKAFKVQIALEEQHGKQERKPTAESLKGFDNPAIIPNKPVSATKALADFVVAHTKDENAKDENVVDDTTTEEVGKDQYNYDDYTESYYSDENYRMDEQNSQIVGDEEEDEPAAAEEFNYFAAKTKHIDEEKKKRASQAWVDHEIVVLLSVITSQGRTDAEGRKYTTFAELCDAYRSISDGLVGILMKAKKAKKVDYQGDILFLEEDGNTVVTIIDDGDL